MKFFDSGWTGFRTWLQEALLSCLEIKLGVSNFTYEPETQKWGKTHKMFLPLEFFMILPLKRLTGVNNNKRSDSNIPFACDL